jgi:hypothetical protein
VAARARHQRPSVTPSGDPGKLRGVRPRQLAVRFALGAAISVIAGILGKAVGARFGGTFLAFPAILPASLTLIEDKEGARRAGRNAVGAILGGVGLIVFATVGEFAFRDVEPYLGVVLALAAWVTASMALYIGLCAVRPDACDRNLD